MSRAAVVGQGVSSRTLQFAHYAIRIVVCYVVRRGEKACRGGVASIQVMQAKYLSNRISISFCVDCKSNDKSNVKNNNSPKQQQ